MTLVALETRRHELAAIALREFLDRCVPEKVLILSNVGEDVWKCPGCEYVHIEDAPSKFDWEMQLWYEVPKHVRTPHMMLLEWDAGLVNPTMWNPEWLMCDYVGAVWPWQPDDLCVGNGGLSLRSLRLISYLAEHRDEFPCLPNSDGLLCLNYRHELERRGFTWTTKRQAEDFAVERGTHSRTFGYHGIFNWPRFLTIEQLAERMRIAVRDPYLSESGMLTGFSEALGRQLVEWMKGQ